MSEAANDDSQLSSLKQRWTEFLRRNGLKTTKQRELIVDVFLKSQGHMSIDEVLARARAENARIGYATVYRTLKLLSEGGIAVMRHFGGSQHTLFELSDQHAHHHDHLICTECGEIFEFENEEIEKLQEQEAERLGGFKIVRHKLEIYGKCSKSRGVDNGRCPREERLANPVATGGASPAVPSA